MDGERSDEALAMFSAAATRRQHPAVPEAVTDGGDGGESEGVIIATTGSCLCYHDPEVLATTRGMVLRSEAEARQLGGVPCSECFPQQDTLQYPFAYVTGDVIALAGGQR